MAKEDEVDQSVNLKTDIEIKYFELLKSFEKLEINFLQALFQRNYGGLLPQPTNPRTFFL